MTTFFDVCTVLCFVSLVIAFFRFTDRQVRSLMHFLLIAVVFAVANQVGNAGSCYLAITLILAGLTYSVLVVRQ
jgi:hypothetical protein